MSFIVMNRLEVVQRRITIGLLFFLAL